MNKFLKNVANIFLYAFIGILPMMIFIGVAGAINLSITILFYYFFYLPGLVTVVLASPFGIVLACMIFGANCFGNK